MEEQLRMEEKALSFLNNQNLFSNNYLESRFVYRNLLFGLLN